jgi:hypothetical protein
MFDPSRNHAVENGCPATTHTRRTVATPVLRHRYGQAFCSSATQRYPRKFCSFGQIIFHRERKDHKDKKFHFSGAVLNSLGVPPSGGSEPRKRGTPNFKSGHCHFSAFFAVPSLVAAFAALGLFAALSVFIRVNPWLNFAYFVSFAVARLGSPQFLCG